MCAPPLRLSLCVCVSHVLTQRAADLESPLRRLRKTAFLSHLYIKTNILPRQARDKHRESTQKKMPFLAPSAVTSATCPPPPPPPPPVLLLLSPFSTKVKRACDGHAHTHTTRVLILCSSRVRNGDACFAKPGSGQADIRKENDDTCMLCQDRLGTGTDARQKGKEYQAASVRRESPSPDA
jgi:hypothetical protein